jgi:beta-aspartyl-peptidase (threonine type)
VGPAKLPGLRLSGDKGQQGTQSLHSYRAYAVGIPSSLVEAYRGVPTAAKRILSRLNAANAVWKGVFCVSPVLSLVDVREGNLMIVVASKNGMVGIKESMEVLKAGGSAIDAVETGIRQVEANPDDHTVGYGGYPNLLGQVELDASIMDGRTLAAGAVGAIQSYRYPISIARKVMEHLPHVFLVGHGAERFAMEMGFEQEDLLTEAARQVWQQRLRGSMSEETLAQLAEQPDLSKWVKMATDPEQVAGTVNFIAQDSQGNICAGVSTSGVAWKYPGRVGDSPIIGAGIYADNCYGAATCTGIGEMAIRGGTARSVVLYLKMGLALAKAGQQAMEDLNDLGGPYRARMNLIVLDSTAQHAGFSNAEGRTYIWMTDDMQEPEEVLRIYVPTKQAEGRNLF